MFSAPTTLVWPIKLCSTNRCAFFSETGSRFEKKVGASFLKNMGAIFSKKCVPFFQKLRRQNIYKPAPQSFTNRVCKQVCRLADAHLPAPIQ
jgi:hypothetical protein